MAAPKDTTERFRKGLEAFLDRDPRHRAALARALFYGDIRGGLRRLRDAVNMSQQEVADLANRHQSEISRLENGLGDGTRLGTVLDYVAACGGRIGFTIWDRDGRVVLDQTENVETIVQVVDHVLQQHDISTAEQAGILQDLRSGIACVTEK